jgi:arylsulfatase
MDAHNPYIASEEYRTQSKLAEFHANVEFWRQSHETPFSESVHEKLVTAYDDSIRYSDSFLDRLRMDLGDDTVLAVHGDHGEAFGEHGTYGHEPYLYRENTHVPFVVSDVESGRFRAPVSLTVLPDVLTSVASRTEWDSTSDDIAISVSQQGSRTAVYMNDGDCISSSDEIEIVRTDRSQESQATQLREIGRRILSGWNQTAVERRRIANSVTSLTAEEAI